MHYQEVKNKFLQELSSKGKLPNTLKNYKNDLAVFQSFLEERRFYSPETSYREIGIKGARDYLDHLSKIYPASNSKRRRLQVIRLFYDFLVKEKIVESNPMKTLPSFPRILGELEPAPYQEIVTLWKSINEEIKSAEVKENLLDQAVALRNALVFILIYSPALTVAQIGKLAKKSIQLTPTPRVMVTPEKRDPYTIPLCKIFASYQKRYFLILNNLGPSHTPHLLLSASSYALTERPLSARGVELIFETYRKKIKITITPKSLRQAAIIRWFNEGHPIGVIRMWMGVAPDHDLKKYEEIKEHLVYQENFLNLRQ